MSRVNHPDTLLSELRELQRRLRLLEAVKVAPRPAARALAITAPLTPLTPSRPVDWPATMSAEWEELSGARIVTASRVRLRSVADEGTSGSVRVLVDGNEVGAEFAVTDEEAGEQVDVTGGHLVVQARWLTGPGSVRVSAFLESF